MAKTLETAAALKKRKQQQKSETRSKRRRHRVTNIAPIAAITFPTSTISNINKDILSIIYRIVRRHWIQHQKKIVLGTLLQTFELYTGCTLQSLVEDVTQFL